MPVRFKGLVVVAALMGGFVVSGAAGGFAQQRAQPGFRVCNQAGTEIEVAKATATGASDGGAQIVISEGWYKLPPQACAYLWPGPLQYRHYLVYAQDKASGREWTGTVPTCVSPEAFTIRSGTCGARQERKLFIPVDVGDERFSWTYVFRP
jgi:uncharacterized membrane protein